MTDVKYVVAVMLATRLSDTHPSKKRLKCYSLRTRAGIRHCCQKNSLEKNLLCVFFMTILFFIVESGDKRLFVLLRRSSVP